MAALIASRIAKYVQEALKSILRVKDTIFWSDSQITLHWISSNKKLKPFNENRVREIRQLSNPAQWHYCPTHLNPADLLTRGLQELKGPTLQFWIEGPSFLKTGVWPQWSFQALMTSVDQETSNTSTSSHIKVQTSQQMSSNLIEIERFSSLNRLIRVTAYVLRFVNNCKGNQKQSDCLSTTELNEAEITLIKQVQRQSFHQELNALQKNTREHSLIRKTVPQRWNYQM